MFRYVGRVLIRRLLAGEEDHLAGLQAGILVEECGQGAGDGGGVGAVLGEGFGGDEDQPGVGLASGPVLGIEGHEVLDVGGDQGAARGGGVSQYLVIGQGEQRGVGDDGEHSCPLERSSSAMWPDNISSSSSGKLTLVSGEQPLLTLPGLFGEFLGRVSGGDLGVDLSGVGGPVPDGDAQERTGTPVLSATMASRSSPAGQVLPRGRT